MIENVDKKLVKKSRVKDDKSNGCPVNGNEAMSELLPRNIMVSDSPVVSLRVFSQVMATEEKGSPLWKTCHWINNFLAKPHQELGRKGSVCPFIPTSVQTNSLWLAEITEADLSVDEIGSIFLQYRDIFLKTEPVQGSGALNKAFIIVFPKLGKSAAKLIDQIHAKFKQEFISLGLMLGEFYLGNPSPGLHNEYFKPMRSPIPTLGIRYMVDLDLPFFTRDIISADDRTLYLRSYLQSLAGQLSKAKLSRAIDALVDAEIEQRLEKSL